MNSKLPQLEIHKSISTPSVSQLSEVSPADATCESPQSQTSLLASPRRFINRKRQQDQTFTTVKNSNQFNEISSALAQYEKAFQLILQRTQMLPNLELTKIVNEQILAGIDLPRELKPMYLPAIEQFQSEKSREKPIQKLLCLVQKKKNKSWKQFVYQNKQNKINELEQKEWSRVQIDESIEQDDAMKHKNNQKCQQQAQLNQQI